MGSFSRVQSMWQGLGLAETVWWGPGRGHPENEIPRFRRVSSDVPVNLYKTIFQGLSVRGIMVEDQGIKVDETVEVARQKRLVAASRWTIWS